MIGKLIDWVADRNEAWANFVLSFVDNSTLFYIFFGLAVVTLFFILRHEQKNDDQMWVFDGVEFIFAALFSFCTIGVLVFFPAMCAIMIAMLLGVVGLNLLGKAVHLSLGGEK